MEHANKRLTVGSKTKEIVINLERDSGSGFDFDHDELKLHVKRRQKGYQITKQWLAYAIDSGGIHFQIPDDFLSLAPKGFYDAKLMFGDCEVADIEIIKAPSVYVKNAKAKTTDCKKTEWVEPCDPPTNCECKEDCNCFLPSGGTCSGRPNKKQINKLNLNSGYSGIYYANQ